jgi:hypothetical protein
MKIIAFIVCRFDMRGVGIAIYDYAHFNETLLNNKSIIFVPKDSQNHNSYIQERFTKRFQVIYFDDLDETCEKYNIDLLYTLKYGRMYGEGDIRLSMRYKTAIHCVFDMSEPHGDIYAGVSQSIAKKYGKKVFVPHIVSIEPDFSEDLKTILNIPEDAIVFGRYGGEDTFNVEFCKKVIVDIVNQRQDIYFLFANTPEFYTHPQIIYLDRVKTDSEKSRFINTCDAYLECGGMGHSFGLAIGEFSVHNKPIIVYNVSNDIFWNDEHIRILSSSKEKSALYFTNEIEFYNILNSWDKSIWIGKDVNCYKQYSPKNVMKIFKQVFIDE